MPRAILTGGPGAGKTTLLRTLTAFGVATVDESARQIIRERKAAGLQPRPAPQAFAAEIFRRDALAYERSTTNAGWTVFDRGAVEAVHGLYSTGSASEAQVQPLLEQYRVEQVFLLPPWPEIYVQDEERDQTLQEAEDVYGLVLEWYRWAGYKPIVVPQGLPQERAAFVASALGAA